MNSLRVVVFGATGNLGANISVYLHNLGYEVIPVGHRKDDNGFFADYGMKYYSVDIENDADFLELPHDDIYAVLHFAGMLPAVMKGFSATPYIQSIIQGTLNVLEYTRKCGAQRIIFPQTLFDIYYLFGTKVPIPADSSRRVPDGDHWMYVVAKNAACEMIEHYYHEFGIKRFILRLSRIYLYHPNPYTYTDGKKVLVSDRVLIYKAIKGEPIEIWGDPYRLLETISVYDFLQIIGKTLVAKVDGGIYNVGSGGTTLEERVRNIVEVFNPKDQKSEIIYRPDKPNGTQFVLDIQKTIFELGYVPQYSWRDYLIKFKNEMETQPFAKLWGREEDYYKF
ncbi:MAG: NAD(P)-dependent oxidoreductase [Bacteroidales bacterium]|nr:NAD(P)-dependent oxidoreductase [Bacteroidales bacterium]